MLEEQVEIWSIDPPRKIGTSLLAVGQGGLPVLLNQIPPTVIWMLPNNWSLRSVRGRAHGPLLQAWTDIEAVLQHIRDAQKEADEEVPAPALEDSITAYKRDADARGGGER